VSRGKRPAAVRLDRRRLIIERTGERSMIYNDFDDVVRGSTCPR
jgi:hypothetical protein